MWQPRIKIETETYPTGNIAPSTFALARYHYVQRAKTWLRRR